MPRIYQKGNDWLIDMGARKASPCFKSREDAERLLRLAKQWDNKIVRLALYGKTIEGKVVNCALWHMPAGLVEKLAVRYNRHTYWVLASACEEVIE